VLSALLAAVLLALPASPLPAQGSAPGEAAVPAGKHRGAVNALVYAGGDRVLSAGNDGFLGIWNIRDRRAETRFQLSSYSLVSMVKRPEKTEIALIESDGLGLYRVSAWDYERRERLFTLRFRDPLSYITYSAGGNFLIVSRSARLGVAFIHPETGEVLQSPGDLSGTVSFAATGISERSMISYAPSGVLSYWSLASGEEIRRFPVSPGIASPILFGNNRFFGGFDAEGLVILDAVSGNELIRDPRVPRGILFSSPDSDEFFCLAVNQGSVLWYGYGINTAGELENRYRWVIPGGTFPGGSAPEITSVTANTTGGILVLGAVDGGLLSFSPGGSLQTLAAAEQLPVREAAASGAVLALILENNRTGFIPLEFDGLDSGGQIRLEAAGAYTQVSPAGESPEGLSRFLFWQTQNTTQAPVLRGISPEDPGPRLSRTTLSGLPLRFPLRSVSTLGNKALFLDSAGNISVLSTETGGQIFSFTAAGALDAAFQNDRNIIIARSSAAGSTPFLGVTIETGETVPLNYGASIGARIYRGESGALYGAVIEGTGGNLKTSILRINPANPAQSMKLVEYQGEDTGFGIAESEWALASTIGGDGATLYTTRGVTPFERSSALPQRIISGGRFFITLDAEGSVAWYENQTGELAALLRLYSHEWVLETKYGANRRGAVVYP
jgi:hypothetical protein